MKQRAVVIAGALLVALNTQACASGGGATSASSGKIPQPSVEESSKLAPASKRVDIDTPKFSDPTKVTNPLFPVSNQESVLLLGTVDGQDFRTEVTLLPETRIIEWQGQKVETLVSQYVAFLGGRIHEVAYDLYAQDDAGAVWYFGEDVYNFGDGAIVDTHGTWLAGKDGPAAMIMPADPKVGDVYRPENIPGFVFEEVTVKDVGRTLEGPFGPVRGGLVVDEFHLLDNASEEKTFGPGYGEFYTASGGDVEALALAVPTDKATGKLPADLQTLVSGALEIAGGEGNSEETLAKMTAAWERYAKDDVPVLVKPVLDDALESLSKAPSEAAAAQAAIEVAKSALDLQLRYRPAVEVDLARFDLWLAQMQLDATAEDHAAVSGDFFSIDYVRDRVMHAVSEAEAAEINLQLEELLGAVGDEDLEAVTEVSTGLRETLASVELN